MGMHANNKYFVKILKMQQNKYTVINSYQTAFILIKLVIQSKIHVYNTIFHLKNKTIKLYFVKTWFKL